jgi:hypothetical protein
VTFAECPHEADVIDALTTTQWPEQCSDELQTHVAACDNCRTLVAALTPLGEAWLDTRAAAHVPASGMVWWRAQMRARREAARAAARPMTIVQAIAALAGVALLVTTLALLSPWVIASFSGSASLLLGTLPDVGGLTSNWAVAAAIALLAMTSLAVYLVMAED